MQHAFIQHAVHQADDLKNDFEIHDTLGTGSFSRIRLALLMGKFNEKAGLFSVRGQADGVFFSICVSLNSVNACSVACSTPY